ncbi:hypothetical protein WAF17_02385 [Bernardetia sp. ABR2-2B]|uniref:hypothetical protein n=1 Tax=Bernardetia sp. ABR2-2B TaxID=3127472 RepID=UPI0030D46DB1
MKVQFFLNSDKATQEHQHVRVSFVKDCIEIIAFICAGIYFLYQLVGNVDITNMDLEVKAQRLEINQDDDHLAVEVKLKKGDIASVYLHDIKGFIYDAQSNKFVDTLLFHGLSRVTIPMKDSTKIEEGYTTFAKVDSTPKYRIASNESTQFSAYQEISHKGAYRVDIIVITERMKLLHNVQSQYRASTITLPIQSKKIKTTVQDSLNSN